MKGQTYTQRDISANPGQRRMKRSWSREFSEKKWKKDISYGKKVSYRSEKNENE